MYALALLKDIFLQPRLQLRHSPGFTPVFPYAVTVHLCLVILADPTQLKIRGGGKALAKMNNSLHLQTSLTF
jgi:hypothetical protein